MFYEENESQSLGIDGPQSESQRSDNNFNNENEGMRVDFVTLGDAAKRIKVAAPTLRGWADKLEEEGVHFLERNHRDERVFYVQDIHIFRYIREQKDKHGRKMTTTDLARTIYSMNEYAKEEGKPEPFNLRIKGEGPILPAHRPNINETDIEHVMEHPKFKEFMTAVVSQATNRMQEQFEKKQEEVADTINKRLSDDVDQIRREMKDEIKELEEKRIEKMDEYLANQRELQQEIQEYYKLGFWERLFKKHPGAKD